MWKPRLGLAPLLALTLLAGACGSSAGPKVGEGEESSARPVFAPGTTMAALQQKGRIRVGTKFDQPLFELKNPITGDIQGFDVEIAKIMAQGIFGGTLKDAAKKIEFMETVSKVRETFIQEGKVDIVVATYGITAARKQVVDFAGPYYVASQDIMVRKDDNSIHSVTDLNGKKVCSVQGSTSLVNVAAKAPRADLSIIFDTYSECAEALRDGRVQAVTTDNSILIGLVNDSRDAFKLVGAPFTTEPYGIGLKKGDDAFREFLNGRIEASERDGSWASAFKRTLSAGGIPIPQPLPVDRYALPPSRPASSTGAATSMSQGEQPAGDLSRLSPLG